ncbi:MAG: hypothetical protein ABIT06_09640 [Saprospiraceae bacterium]
MYDSLLNRMLVWSVRAVLCLMMFGLLILMTAPGLRFFLMEMLRAHHLKDEALQLFMTHRTETSSTLQDSQLPGVLRIHGVLMLIAQTGQTKKISLSTVD